jgi:hypothetical protein
LSALIVSAVAGWVAALFVAYSPKLQSSPVETLTVSISNVLSNLFFVEWSGTSFSDRLLW